MKRIGMSVAVLAVVAVLGTAKEKIRPTVPFARTWEAAVEEAKLLNVPIVVHSHGFY